MPNYKKLFKRGGDLLLLGILTLTVGCGDSPHPATEYKTLRVERQDYTTNRRFMARIESQQRVNVRPVIDGILKKICVREGAQVKKGQPLFIIDQAPYIAAVDAAKAQVATAQAVLATAQLNLEGKEQLYAKQMVGEFDLRRSRSAQEEAAAQLESAQAELATALTNLNYTTICSPVDGSISMSEFFEGELVGPSIDRLVTIAANGHIYAYTSLSDKLLSDLLKEYGCHSTDELISRLPEVTLITTWGEELPQKGRIDAISGETDISTGTVLVRASFENATQLFHNGGNGYIDLPTLKHGVFVIPQDAIARVQDKYFTYRVIEGKAVSTEVKATPSSDGLSYIVTGGLSDGETIIAENIGMVSEGTIVVPTEKEP